jgi:hypothetical protein
MQRFLALLAVLGVVGCVAKKEEVAVEGPEDRLSPGCYTVDLFDPYQIEYPGPGVPEEATDFRLVCSQFRPGDAGGLRRRAFCRCDAERCD